MAEETTVCSSRSPLIDVLRNRDETVTEFLKRLLQKLLPSFPNASNLAGVRFRFAFASISIPLPVLVDVACAVDPWSVVEEVGLRKVWREFEMKGSV